MCVWHYSLRGDLWFVLERAYTREWGSPHKNSWLKCKMLWTEHKDVLTCLFHRAAPSPHRAGRAAAAPALMHRAHSTCYRSHFLSGKPVLFLCLISWHFSMNSQGGSAMSIRRACHDLSQHPQGTGALQHTGTHSPSSSPANPLLDIPSPSHNKHRPVFWGAREGCVWVHSYDPLRTLVPTTHTQRCGWTRHCAVTQHTPMSDNNALFTRYGHENAWNRPAWQENIHSGR